MDPFLETIVGRGFGAQLRLVQGLPLATGTEDVEDGIGAAAVGNPRTSAAEAVGVEMDRDEGLQDGPEGIGHTEAGGGAVVRGTSPRPFR